MTWPHVVALLILSAAFFFTAWQAPLVLVMIVGAILWSRS